MNSKSFSQQRTSLVCLWVSQATFYVAWLNNYVWVWEVFARDFSRGSSCCSLRGDKCSHRHVESERHRLAARTRRTLKAHLISNSFYEPTHPSDFKRHFSEGSVQELSRSLRDVSAEPPYFVDARHYWGIYIYIYIHLPFMWLVPGQKQKKHFQNNIKAFTSVIRLSDIKQ